MGATTQRRVHRLGFTFMGVFFPFLVGLAFYYIQLDFFVISCFLMLFLLLERFFEHKHLLSSFLSIHFISNFSRIPFIIICPVGQLTILRLYEFMTTQYTTLSLNSKLFTSMFDLFIALNSHRWTSLYRLYTFIS